MGKQPLIGFVLAPEHKAIGCQQERPEKQRAFLPRPQNGELIGRGQIAIPRVGRFLRFVPSPAPPNQGNDPGDKTVAAQDQSQEKHEASDLRHGTLSA